MRIIYADSNYFTLYNCETKFFQTIYDSLDQILLNSKTHDYFLVPEFHFIFTSKIFQFYVNEPFSITQFKHLLEEYSNEQKKELTHINQMIHYDTRNISIDGEQTAFFLGRKGQLRFQLDCVFGNNASEIDFSSIIQKKVNLLPCSFGTLHQCNGLINDTDYSILYIHNTESKLIQVKNQFYQSIQNINFGKETLKLMYQEHNLLKYYRDPNSTSPVTESIVKDITGFFAEKIIDWLSALLIPQSNLIIISDITKNTYFMEALKTLYNQFINGYILPMSIPAHESGLPTDISTTLRYIKKTVER